MNTFASDALNGLSPYKLVFVRCTPDLTKLRIPDIGNTSKLVKEYYNILTNVWKYPVDRCSIS